MAKYEHKGVGIELSGRGDFVATVGGKHRVFASVTSAKKAIDKAEGFVQFTALRDRNWQDPKGSDALVRVTIVGVSKKGGRGWANQPVWVDADGHEYGSVYADTPANEAALAAQAALKIRHDEETTRMRAERDAASEAVVNLTPAR